MIDHGARIHAQVAFTRSRHSREGIDNLSREGGDRPPQPQLLAEGSPWFDLLYVASPAEMLLFGEERAEGLSALSSSGDERRDVYSRLVSRRFQIDVAEPALERLLQAPVGVPSREVLRWTRTVFGVTAHPGESRLALLARVLESTSLAADLDSADLVWSVAALTTALRDACVPKVASEALGRHA